MTSFQEAIDVAQQNAKTLIPNSSNFAVEGVMISDNEKLYEVSLSYDLLGKDPLTVKEDRGELYQLATIMGYRRHHKTFLIDAKHGGFKGFKNQEGY